VEFRSAWNKRVFNCFLNEDREVVERRSTDGEFQIIQAANLKAPSAIFVAVAGITRSDFPDGRVILIGISDM